MISETAPQSKSPTWRLRIAQTAIVVSAVSFSGQFTSYLHLKEIVLALALLVLAALAVATGENLRPSFRAYRPLWLLWAASVTVHVGIGQAAKPHLAITSLCIAAMLLVLAVLVEPVSLDMRGRWGLINAIVLAGVIVSVLGLLQVAGAVPFLFPPYPEYLQPMYSVFGNRNLLAAWLVMALPLALHIFVSGRANPKLYAASIVPMAAALALCGSRSGWVAGFLGVAAVIALTPMRLLVRMRWALGLLLLGVLAFVSLMLLTDDAFWEKAQHSAGLRWWFWNGAGDMFAANPLLGVGPGHYAYWSPVYLGEILWQWQHAAPAINEVHTWHAHNDVLELAATAGLAGGLCFAWFIVLRMPSRGPEWYGLIPLVLFALVNPVFSSAPHAFAALVLSAGLLPQPADATPKKHRLANAGVAGFVVAFAAFLAVVHWWPSYRLRAAHDLQLSGEDARAHYAEIAAEPWPNPYAEQGLAIAAMTAQDYAGAVAAWRRALDEGLQDGEVYYGLATSALWTGDRETTAWAAGEGLKRWPANPHLWSLRVATAPEKEIESIKEQAAPFVGSVWPEIENRAEELRREFGL